MWSAWFRGRGRLGWWPWTWLAIWGFSDNLWDKSLLRFAQASLLIYGHTYESKPTRARANLLCQGRASPCFTVEQIVGRSTDRVEEVSRPRNRNGPSCHKVHRDSTLSPTTLVLSRRRTWTQGRGSRGKVGGPVAWGVRQTGAKNRRDRARP